MKLIISIFLTFSLTNNAISQKAKGKEDVYDKDKLFTQTDTPPIFSGNLSHYIDSVLMGEWLPDEGRVIVEVIIDSNGAPHYKYLMDHTNGDVSNLRLKLVIDKMPTWTPAYQNGRSVNFILILLLDFSGGKLIRVSNKSMNEEMRYMLNSNKP